VDWTGLEWFDFLALKLMGNKSAAKMYFICTGQTHGSYLPEQWEIKIINVRNKTQGDIRCPLYMYGGMCQKLWLPWLAHKNWLWHLIRCFFFASISFWNGNWQSHKADGVFRLVYCCTNTSLKSLNLWCHLCYDDIYVINVSNSCRLFRWVCVSFFLNFHPPISGGP